MTDDKRLFKGELIIHLFLLKELMKFNYKKKTPNYNCEASFKYRL